MVGIIILLLASWKVIDLIWIYVMPPGRRAVERAIRAMADQVGSNPGRAYFRLSAQGVTYLGTAPVDLECYHKGMTFRIEIRETGPAAVTTDGPGWRGWGFQTTSEGDRIRLTFETMRQAVDAVSLFRNRGQIRSDQKVRVRPAYLPEPEE